MVLEAARVVLEGDVLGTIEGAANPARAAVDEEVEGMGRGGSVGWEVQQNSVMLMNDGDNVELSGGPGSYLGTINNKGLYIFHFN